VYWERMGEMSRHLGVTRKEDRPSTKLFISASCPSYFFIGAYEWGFWGFLILWLAHSNSIKAPACPADTELSGTVSLY